MVLPVSLFWILDLEKAGWCCWQGAVSGVTTCPGNGRETRLLSTSIIYLSEQDTAALHWTWHLEFQITWLCFQSRANVLGIPHPHGLFFSSDQPMHSHAAYTPITCCTKENFKAVVCTVISAFGFSSVCSICLDALVAWRNGGNKKGKLTANYIFHFQNSC